MEKKECLQKLSEFVVELDCITGLSKAGRAERTTLIKKINKDIVFIRDYKLTDKVHDLLIQEIMPHMKEFRVQKEFM